MNSNVINGILDEEKYAWYDLPKFSALLAEKMPEENY